ncbi:MAG TPA: beta-galactosidase [Thermoguttaceae bacterium]|nr:beta-galactosidase [Thermoguttaceae bacterium]
MSTQHRPSRHLLALSCVFAIGAVHLLGSTSVAQMIDRSATRSETDLKIGWKRAGTLIPRSADEIGPTDWAIGCETLDRDFADYDAYKEYLVPLGIGRVRFQGGWAKTEQVRGVYDFAWLDRLIDDATSRGLNVWLETSYGNPLYAGGGGQGLSGMFPQGEEALGAWDRWVEAMAVRYKAKVREWGMWNEPNNKGIHTPAMTADMNIRTAAIIKRIIPDAEIAGLVQSSLSSEYLEGFLKRVADRESLHLFDWIVYHGYQTNPDDSYAAVRKMTAIVKRYDPRLKMWQGENGAPSEWIPAFALSKTNWSELTQAKWDTRRMLGDRGHDCRSLVFTMADLVYRRDGSLIHNRKGLLKTDIDTQQIVKVKLAYFAVQNVVSLFDSTLCLAPDLECEIGPVASLASPQEQEPVTWYGHRNMATGQDIVVFWNGNHAPSDSNDTAPACIVLKDAQLTDPVYVDLITGRVYEIPGDRKQLDGTTWSFQSIPVYDSPTVILDRDLLKYEPWPPNTKRLQ